MVTSLDSNQRKKVDKPKENWRERTGEPQRDRQEGAFEIYDWVKDRWMRKEKQRGRARLTERTREKRRVREPQRGGETKTGLMEGMVTVTNSCLSDTHTSTFECLVLKKKQVEKQ